MGQTLVLMWSALQSGCPSGGVGGLVTCSGLATRVWRLHAFLPYQEV